MRLPFLLLPILACSVLHATTAAAAAATSCEPSACGNVTIAYPFWLSSASPPCGPPAFQVASRASLARSFRGGYKILRVLYANRTVVVANDNVQTDASAANRQLVFLFNCTSRPPGFVNVTCPGTPAVVRLDPGYNTTDARAVAGDCEYSVVPVVGSPGASAGDYPRLLRGGYLLEWTASDGDCQACDSRGGRCGYDSGNEAFACICADGSSRCDAKNSKNKVMLIASLSVAAGLLLACLVIALKFRRQISSSILFNIFDRSSSSDTANVEKLLKKYGSLAPRRLLQLET